MQKKQNSKLYNLICILAITGVLVGIGIVIYPYFVDKYYEYLNQQAISGITSIYDKYDENSPEIQELQHQAKIYNDALAGEYDGTEEIWDYQKQLVLEDTDIMAYLEIPKLEIKMSIYHGTTSEVLAAGVGHLADTSLPVGGESTHCVLTAHSGMKSMKAFDNLRFMEVGDLFAVTTLGKQYVYEVYEIETVLPYETESLSIVKGEDLVTLVTCTPYGINDHRLLVHARRTTKALDTVSENTSDIGTNTENDQNAIISFLFKDMRLIPVMAVGLGVFITIIVFIVKSVKKKKKDEKDEI